MKNKTLKLAELLPENISKESLDQIVKLISDFINEEVGERMKLLEAKTLAFIRGNMDLIKDSALNELKGENDVYQDALKFRKLQETFGVTGELKENKDLDELNKENDVLIEQLNNLVEAYTELEAKYKKVRRSYKQIKESTNVLTEEVQTLKDEKKPFKSSEKALIISESEIKETESYRVDNEFLTKDVIALVSKSKGK